jgi:septal ring factor EnvC (AmiA/AmiB activator)
MFTLPVLGSTHAAPLPLPLPLPKAELSLMRDKEICNLDITKEMLDQLYADKEHLRSELRSARSQLAQAAEREATLQAAAEQGVQQNAAAEQDTQQSTAAGLGTQEKAAAEQDGQQEAVQV